MIHFLAIVYQYRLHSCQSKTKFYRYLIAGNNSIQLKHAAARGEENKNENYCNETFSTYYLKQPEKVKEKETTQKTVE